jgi:CBS domain containing-hemolysin-like protein
VNDVTVVIGVIVALILANALFVAAEFAIVGAPRAAIEHEAAQGSLLAQRVAKILGDPRRQDRYIATTQIGISIASVGLGMYGEHALAQWIEAGLAPLGELQWVAVHTLASIGAVALLTYFHIVVGEMVPKALALQRAQRTVLFVSPVIEGLQTAILPLVVGLNAAGNGLLTLIGIERQEVDAERYHSTEELQLIIKESQEGGMLRGEAGALLRELFEFGDLSAVEVMVPRVRLVGIPVGTDVDELRQIVRHAPHTRYVVYAGDLDHIIGSIHIKALLRHFVARRPVTANDARPLPYVPETMPIDEVLSSMRRQRAQMAVVMDEHGGTAGVVTIGDLFEEVVGEIEENRGDEPMRHDAAGRLIVDGTVRLRDAGEALGLTLAHGDVQSISGLVLMLLGRPAAVGDAVAWNGVRVEVLSVDGRGVGQAAVTKSG